MGLIPTLFAGLLQRAFFWFAWSDPVATQPESKPRPPRRPTLSYHQGVVPDDVMAVLRLSWYRHGRVRHVEEAQLLESEESFTVLAHILNEALNQGVDVTMISAYPADELGLLDD